MLAIYCRTSRESNDSTIEQQEQKGLEFALSHKFRFEVYTDEGKSGFKVEDETNPFSNRPAFTDLMNDIKANKETKVWVLEHSRLSRNQYASAFIFSVLEKHNVTLCENDKELSLKDPQYKFMRQILDAVSQYERDLIVNRTTRGLHNAINNGKRAHARFYGYKRVGRDESGHTVWEPVESELEKIMFAYKTFLDGGTINSIIRHLYAASPAVKMLSLTNKWSRILSHFEYTGYCLNIDGLDILHKYQRFEIDNPSALKELKYMTKSASYTVELVSVEDWIKCAERLRANKAVRRNILDKSSRRASKDLCTGLIQCGRCGGKYYAYFIKYCDKSYLYYKHINTTNTSVCQQRPKTFSVSKINKIYKIFYFYYYFVFDDTKSLIEESMREIRIQQAETRERIASIEKQLAQFEKQTKKFSVALDSTDDVGVIQVLAGRISAAEEKISKDTELLAALKIELETLNEKYSGTELQNVCYSTKDRITIFFEKMNIEQQRNELLRVVKKSVIFGDYLTIEAGKKMFVFNVSHHKMYKFDSDSYDNLMNDQVYFDNFLNLDTAKGLKSILFNGRLLNDWELDKKYKREKMRTVADEFLRELGLVIDLEPIDRVVSFLDVERFMAFMMMRTPTNTYIGENGLTNAGKGLQ
jgi:DNA invertase Pin-like site-specific DNA recombinase